MVVPSFRVIRYQYVVLEAKGFVFRLKIHCWSVELQRNGVSVVVLSTASSTLVAAQWHDLPVGRLLAEVHAAPWPFVR